MTKHTGLHQFLTQLRQITLILRFVNRLQYAFQIRQFSFAFGDLCGQHLLGRLGLVVKLEILLGVLLRGQANVQVNLNLRAGFVKIIDDFGAGHALFQLIKIRGNQFAHAFVFVAVFGLFQFLPLGAKLARQTVAGCRHRADHVHRAAAHAFGLPFLFIEGSQQSRKTVHFGQFHQAFILPDGQERKVLYRMVLPPGEQHGVKYPRLYALHELVKGLGQPLALVRCQTAGGPSGLPYGAVS